MNEMAEPDSGDRRARWQSLIVMFAGALIGCADRREEPGVLYTHVLLRDMFPPCGVPFRRADPTLGVELKAELECLRSSHVSTLRGSWLMHVSAPHSSFPTCDRSACSSMLHYILNRGRSAEVMAPICYSHPLRSCVSLGEMMFLILWRYVC